MTKTVEREPEPRLLPQTQISRGAGMKRIQKRSSHLLMTVMRVQVIQSNNGVVEITDDADAIGWLSNSLQTRTPRPNLNLHRQQTPQMLQSWQHIARRISETERQCEHISVA